MLLLSSAPLFSSSLPTVRLSLLQTVPFFFLCLGRPLDPTFDPGLFLFAYSIRLQPGRRFDFKIFFLLRFACLFVFNPSYAPSFLPLLYIGAVGAD